MRIDELHLEDFKNLRDFDVDFDIGSSRQVIVGRNSVGKSNLLEAIARIFRDLDLEVDEADEENFAYSLEYHCNGHFVRVQSSRKKAGGRSPRFVRSYEIASDKGSPTLSKTARRYQAVSRADFYTRNRPSRVKGLTSLNPSRLLPSYVFGYYSGVSGRFDEIFSRHEEQYYRQQIRGEEAPLRPLFLAKPHHSQFALLSFFAKDDPSAQAFLADEFRIVGLDSVLFALQEPWYARSQKRLPKGSDRRFWQTGGKVRPLLEALFRHSLAPMSALEKVRESIGQESRKQRRFLYLPSQEALRKVAGDLEPKEFFSRLESAIFSDVVSSSGNDVRTRIQISGAKSPILFRELAEGEQQLLTLIGLMRFTKQDESLFLLDEPDTHLNPAWCLDYLENLRKYGVEPEGSQILLSTHNPLTFGGLLKEEVVMLERQPDGRIVSSHPSSDPRGMGFAAILTSELFGLRAALDEKTVKKLDEKRELGLKEKKTDDDKRRLAALNDELGRLDFASSARDPLYLEYVRAMTEVQAEHPELAATAPSVTTWRQRQEIAKDIARRLAEREAAR